MFQDLFGEGFKMCINICNSRNYIGIIFNIKKAFYFIKEIHLFYFNVKKTVANRIGLPFFHFKKMDPALI